MECPFYSKKIEIDQKRILKPGAWPPRSATPRKLTHELAVLLGQVGIPNGGQSKTKPDNETMGKPLDRANRKRLQLLMSQLVDQFDLINVLTALVRDAQRSAQADQLSERMERSRVWADSATVLLAALVAIEQRIEDEPSMTEDEILKCWTLKTREGKEIPFSMREIDHRVISAEASRRGVFPGDRVEKFWIPPFFE